MASRDNTVKRKVNPRKLTSVRVLRCVHAMFQTWVLGLFKGLHMSIGSRACTRPAETVSLEESRRILPGRRRAAYKAPHSLSSMKDKISLSFREEGSNDDGRTESHGAKSQQFHRDRRCSCSIDPATADGIGNCVH